MVKVQGQSSAGALSKGISAAGCAASPAATCH